MQLLDLHCENCGQPALASDSTCWQCGELLPGREENSLENVSVKEGWQGSVSLTSLGFYLGSTFAAIIIFFIAAYALGQSPLIQVGLGNRPPSQWALITNADQSMALWLPESWIWHDKAERIHRAEFAALVEATNVFHLALLPLASAVGDMELIFIASGSDSLDKTSFPILAVGRSVALNRLHDEDLLAFIREEDGDITVHDVEAVENFDKSHISLDVEAAIGDGGLDSIRCRQQFVRGHTDSVVVSLCAPAGEFIVHQSIFETVLGSFQKLIS